MEKIRAMIDYRKTVKYIPKSIEINADSNGEVNIQKKSAKNISLDYNNSRQPEITCPEHSVEVKLRFGKYNGYKFINYKLFTKVLSWLCVLLIASLLILLITGYSLPSDEYCMTAKCVRSAAIIKLALNLSVDPCDNFYQYTCGRWSKEYPLYPGYESNSKFLTISERISAAVLKFLSAENHVNEINPVKQSRMFYKSCLDRESRVAMGFTAIYEYLEILGLPRIPTIFSKVDEDLKLPLDWVKLETQIKKIFDMDVFIGFEISPNRFNTLQHLLYIGRPSKLCPLLRPYKHKITEKEWRNLIAQIIHHLVRNATNESPPEELLKQTAKIIDEMTSKIHMYIVPRNYSEKYNFHTEYSLRELQDEIDVYTTEKSNRTYPQFLQKYLDHMFQGTANETAYFKRNTLYIRGMQKPYLFQILTHLLETPDVHIELYLWWSVVVCMVMSSSPSIHKLILEQYEPQKRNPWLDVNKITSTHKRYCANEVVQSLGLVVAYGIANDTFSTESGLQIKIMVEELRKAFKESVSQISWMDKKAKKAILEKSENMYTFIGFPKWLFMEGELEKYYEGMDMNSTTYLHNLMEIVRRLSTETLEHYYARNHSNVERDFPKNPMTINAFNMFWTNSIVIPLGIVTFPLYHLGLEVLNYGTMGAVLGHELIHGFDNFGWQYDKYGSYRKWLPADLIETFKQKSECFLKQYDNITIKGVKGQVSGQLTLGENIADNGGIRHALSAYKNFRSRVGNEPKLPGFENFTHEQLFFIAYAGIWCRVTSPQRAEYLIRNDPHSPSFLRANIAVSNFEDFARAFSCPKGSKMNPIKKCIIW